MKIMPSYRTPIITIILNRNFHPFFLCIDDEASPIDY